MRRLVFSTLTTLLGVGLMSGAAAAATTVTFNSSISNTGPNSTNTVNCVDKNDIDVTCSNTGTIVETNNQTSNSGSATVNGNTTGGSSTSGNASNSNTYTVQLGASCAPVTTPSNTTPSGGKGGGGFTTSAVIATTAPTVSPSAPASLPNTGSNAALKDALFGLAGLGGLVAVSLSSVGIKRHLVR